MGPHEPSALERLTAAIRSAWEKVPDRMRARPVALCLSGGADSCALALAASALSDEGWFPGGLEALHARHQLRGGESAGDADAVHELCGRLGLPLRQVDAPVVPGPNLEARARAARYLALRQAFGEGILTTAHHRGDLAETVVLRLLRGAGVRGLASLRPWRDDGIWRPLLAVDRATTARACREADWTSREDSSNRDPAFLRNALRLELLPRWEDREPGILEALAQLGEAAADLEPWLDRGLDRLADVVGLKVQATGFSLAPGRLPEAASDPELDLLLERTWTRIGRRPWAREHRQRLLEDAVGGKRGRRLGGQGEVALWGGGSLRVEARQYLS